MSKEEKRKGFSKSDIFLSILLGITLVWLVGLPGWMYLITPDVSDTWLWISTTFDWVIVGGLIIGFVMLLSKQSKEPEVEEVVSKPVVKETVLPEVVERVSKPVVKETVLPEVVVVMEEVSKPAVVIEKDIVTAVVPTKLETPVIKVKHVASTRQLRNKNQVRRKHNISPKRK